MDDRALAAGQAWTDAEPPGRAYFASARRGWRLPRWARLGLWWGSSRG